MSSGHRRLGSRVAEWWEQTWMAHVAWRLRHPSVRRCPRCKRTYESKWLMDRYQGGVCHDCWYDDEARAVYWGTR